jgi:hypothetical protein
VTEGHVPYLIVATDYATTCSGTCQTCVLSKEERRRPIAATTPELMLKGMQAASDAYGDVGTLAVGIGRANVLDLPESSVDEIGRVAKGAQGMFGQRDTLIEISTSLVGKLDHQTTRARHLLEASGGWNADVRFVVVANTALHSDKYWKNVESFLSSLEDARREVEGDGNGDILQLALSLDSLPDPEELAARVAYQKAPLNLTWAPAFDRGLETDGALRRMGAWIERWYKLTAVGMDSSLVNRVRQSLRMMDSGLKEAVEHARSSSAAVVYVTPDGGWHNGLFTVLAEMDPVRFDPEAHGGPMVSTAPQELRRLISNQACRECPFVNACISSGSHRIGLMTLRRFPKGTEDCPSGLRGAFEAAWKEREEMGRRTHA